MDARCHERGLGFLVVTCTKRECSGLLRFTARAYLGSGLVAVVDESKTTVPMVP